MKARLTSGPNHGVMFTISDPVPNIFVPEIPDEDIDFSKGPEVCHKVFRVFTYKYVGTTNEGIHIYRYQP